MSLKCPMHQKEVLPMCDHEIEIKGSFANIVVRRITVITSKCPEFGCGYTIESDGNGVVIRDSEGNS
jgi:hypothetical protein